jgi:hemoglobin-like flavoprotein
MITATQKVLVQESFALVAPIAETAAWLFYNRLFEVDPSLRPLFKGDIGAQGRMLMQALALSVKSLDRPDLLIPVLQDLGRRHARYGVQDSHYDTVGGALIWTLEKGLGERFTNDVREAWLAVYTLVSITMKDAARAEAAA